MKIAGAHGSSWLRLAGAIGLLFAALACLAIALDRSEDPGSRAVAAIFLLGAYLREKLADVLTGQQQLADRLNELQTREAARLGEP